MKKILLSVLLISHLFSVSIIVKEETQINPSDLAKIYRDYAQGETFIGAQPRQIKPQGSVATFNTNKNSNEFFVGFSYGYNLSGVSTLKNSEYTRTSAYSALPLSGSLGLAMDSVDLYLMGIYNQLDSAKVYQVVGGGFRYKLMVTDFLYPYIALESGYAMTTDSDANPVDGMLAGGDAGLGLDVGFVSLKVGYSYNMVYWNYPVKGITNSFVEQNVKADASIKF